MTDQQKENRDLRKQSKKATRTPEQDRAALQRKVKMFYDLQRLRMQAAGRTHEHANDVILHEVDKAILEARARDLHHAEKEGLKDIEAHLKTMPAFNEILADKVKWKGIGPTMAGVLLSEIDITRCNTPSALWRYAGLAPQKCFRCAHCNDVMVKKKGGYEHKYNRQKKCTATSFKVYESSEAERPKKGEKLHYNRFLKTKLVGVMGSCLIKANSPWRKFYDDYKHRLVSAGKGMSDGHRHNMSVRYMVKMLLLEFWTNWRELEGLPIREPYQEQYLGHKHAI